MNDITVSPTPAIQLPEPTPTKPNALVERKAVRPFGSYRLGKTTIVQPNPTRNSPLELELAEVNRAWRTYRSIKDRDAVYIYLASVFSVVTRWQRLNCALNKSRAALRLRPNPPQLKPEPFGIVIFCTADPKIVDTKTRSKWSRVLRYAARVKPPGQRLTDFIKSNGGLNECARKLARIAG